MKQQANFIITTWGLEIVGENQKDLWATKMSSCATERRREYHEKCHSSWPTDHVHYVNGMWVLMWVCECCVKPQKLELRFSGLYRDAEYFPAMRIAPGQRHRGCAGKTESEHTPSKRSASLLYVTQSTHKSHLPCTILSLFSNFDITFTPQWQTNSFESFAYWTVHHLDIWIKVDQFDDTCFIMSSGSAYTRIPHHQQPIPLHNTNTPQVSTIQPTQ